MVEARQSCRRCQPLRSGLHGSRIDEALHCHGQGDIESEGFDGFLHESRGSTERCGGRIDGSTVLTGESSRVADLRERVKGQAARVHLAGAREARAKYRPSRQIAEVAGVNVRNEQSWVSPADLHETACVGGALREERDVRLPGLPCQMSQIALKRGCTEELGTEEPTHQRFVVEKPFLHLYVHRKQVPNVDRVSIPPHPAGDDCRNDS